MPRILPFALLLLAVEIPLTTPELAPAVDVQQQSVAATDGDSYFVIWTDDRTRNRETWGTRVSRDGVPLDVSGIRLFEGQMRSAQMIWTGTSYLIVWSFDGSTWMLRVDRDENVIDPARAIVAGAAPASIAKSASQVVIGYSRGNELHALFVTPDGRPIVDLLLPARDEQHDGPQIAWTGLHFVAVWTAFGEPSRIEGVRFGQAGSLDREPRVLATGGAAQRVRLASGGTSLAMLSSTGFDGVRNFVRSVSADLTSVGPAVQLPQEIASEASIVWTGTNYVVTGAFGAVTSGVRLDAGAHLIDANAIRIAEGNATGASASPSIASNGRDLLVAWTGRIGPANDLESDVFGALASPATLVPRSQDVLSFTPRRQSRPTITNGTNTLLALWTESDGLWAKRLARNGASIDPTPIRVHDQEGVAQATFNGTNFVIAWTDSREIRTFRIPEAGALRADAAGTIAAWGGFSLALASAGGTTALVTSGNALRVTELGADASFVAGPRILATGTIGTVDIAAAGNGVFFVAWGEMEFLPPTFETAQPRRVLATRLLPSLINLHPAPITIADTSAFEGEPSVVWNGSTWVVVWTESKSVLRARHVSFDGNPIGSEFFVASNAILPDATWDGSRYVIAWVGTEDGFPSAYRAAWISRLGTPPIHAVEFGEAEHWPPQPIAVTTIAPNDVAFAYARLAHESGSVARAFANLTRPPVVRRRAVH